LVARRRIELLLHG